MTRCLWVSAVFACQFSIAEIVTAYQPDLTPPPWRGAPLSTTQQWSFSSGLAGGAPDVPCFNPYGTPIIQFSGDVEWHATIDVPYNEPRTGVLELKKGGTTPKGTVMGGIPNTVVDFGVVTACKQDCLQLDFRGSNTPRITIQPIPGQGDFTVVDGEIAGFPELGGWSHLSFYHTYYATSSPRAETFVISPSGDQSLFVDHVVFDTVVIPEPGSSLLCVVGPLLAGRRKR